MLAISIYITASDKDGNTATLDLQLPEGFTPENQATMDKFLLYITDSLTPKRDILKVLHGPSTRIERNELPTEIPMVTIQTNYGYQFVVPTSNLKEATRNYHLGDYRVLIGDVERNWIWSPHLQWVNVGGK